MASSKREKELARQRAERQAARRAAAAKRTKQRRAVIASVVAVLLVAAVAIAVAASVRGGGDDTAGTAAAPAPSAAVSAPPSASTEPSASAAPSLAPGDPGCKYPEGGAPASRKVPPPPVQGVDVKQVYDVTIATNRGNIVFTMDSAAAPCTANSLRALAGAGYFDNTPCHRLTTSGISVLQCGDPTGTGSGGPGYTFADENLEGATYPRGTVAMANAGPDTNGSQFFLVYADSTLPPQYTPFGTITAGLDVLDQVAAAGTDDTNGSGDGKPVLPVQIQTLRATPKA